MGLLGMVARVEVVGVPGVSYGNASFRTTLEVSSCTIAPRPVLEGVLGMVMGAVAVGVAGVLAFILV
jgi:hypothetical protein